MGMLVLLIVIMIVYSWWSGRLSPLGAIPVLILGIMIGNAGHGTALLDMLGQVLTGAAEFTSQLVL